MAVPAPSAIAADLHKYLVQLCGAASLQVCGPPLIANPESTWSLAVQRVFENYIRKGSAGIRWANLILANLSQLLAPIDPGAQAKLELLRNRAAFIVYPMKFTMPKKEPAPTEDNNTGLYVVIGAGVVAVGVGLWFAFTD